MRNVQIDGHFLQNLIPLTSCKIVMFVWILTLKCDKMTTEVVPFDCQCCNKNHANATCGPAIVDRLAGPLETASYYCSIVSRQMWPMAAASSLASVARVGKKYRSRSARATQNLLVDRRAEIFRYFTIMETGRLDLLRVNKQGLYNSFDFLGFILISVYSAWANISCRNSYLNMKIGKLNFVSLITKASITPSNNAPHSHTDIQTSARTHANTQAHTHIHTQTNKHT